MTDHKDSGAAMDKQAPPTDRPLTAGDVALLREGDVLRSTYNGVSSVWRGLCTVSRVLGDGSFSVTMNDRNLTGNFSGSDFHAFTFVSRPAPVPEAGEGVEPVAWPETCDGTEQPAFEVWAAVQRFDMHEHPLHYLFMDPRTNAARQGWKAGLEHAVARMKVAHPAPTDRVAELEAALDHPLLRQVLGFVEDCAPDEVMNTLRLWQDTQCALLSAQPRAKGEGK